MNIKNLFLFGVVYSSIYVFLLSQIGLPNNIKNYSSFNFLNLNTDISNIETMYGGVNSYYFHFFFTTINMTFILYIISYITLPFYFVIHFFVNIIALIAYEIMVLQYPISILPFGFGTMLTGMFYIILILTIITGVNIMSSGVKNWILKEEILRNIETNL